MRAPSRHEKWSRRSRRRFAAGLAGLAVCITGSSSYGHSTAPELRSNPNTASAGVLKNGVLTLTLDAAPAAWRFSKTHPPMTVAAFSELGKPPLMPGPLVRVPVGTELRLTIHNSLDKPLSFAMPIALHGGADVINAVDSILIAPGASDTISERASVPGNFVYRGAIPDGAAKISHRSGVLGGAVPGVLPHRSAGQRPSDHARHDARALAACGQGWVRPAQGGAGRARRRASGRHCETWDVEFTPERRGLLRLEARESGGPRALQVRVPIRVK